MGFTIEGFDSIATARELSRRSRFASRLLWQNKSYYLVPSIAPLVEGHLLLLPQRHYRSLAASYAFGSEDFDQAFSFAHRYLALSYCQPIIFEHGSGVVSDGASTVEYAHLHLLPVEPHYQQKLFSVIWNDLPLKYCRSLHRALGQLPNDRAYLLCGNIGQVVYSEVKTLPSQYMRRVVAEVLKLDSWHWRKMGNWDLFDRTIDKFRSNGQKE